MNLGFVYILLNPAFPRQLKIGRTGRDPRKRARELSGQTGVPQDFIIIYDELVSDTRQVEALIHEKLDGYRVSRMKEFFVLPPKDAILALQEIASRFPVPPSLPRLVADLLPHFLTRFSKYMDPRVVGLRFVQRPGVCYLEVDRRTVEGGRITTSMEDISLGGLDAPENPTLATLAADEARLHACDAYDWIHLSGVFPADTAQQIANEWEGPGGELERLRGKET